MGDSSEKFAGFPASRLTFTAVPSAFFSRLLPGIDDLAELKVTLHLFWLLQQKKGDIRFARWQELLADRTLIEGLGIHGGNVADTLGAALERAVARGTVLNLDLESPEGADRLYFLNTGEGRQAVAKLRRGEVGVPPSRYQHPLAPAPAVRSPLVALYERQISLLTPGVAAALAQAEQEYGRPAVEAAIQEAVRYERRHWAYVKRVLENRAVRKVGEAENGEAH